jgi:hypothetical protein
MSSILDATQGIDSFCCAHEGQSYYLDFDSRTFRVMRFDGKRWIAEEHSFPEDTNTQFLSEGRSFSLNGDLIVFFFSDSALRFDLSTKTFGKIVYRNLYSKKVWGVFQTANYFYLEYVNAGSGAITRSKYFRIDSLKGDFLDCSEYRDSIPVHWLPVFGVNDVIRSSNGFFRDIRRTAGPLVEGHDYLAIFDDTPRKDFYQTVDGRRFFGHLGYSFVTRSSWIYWGSDSSRYSIESGSLYVHIGPVLVYTMLFTNIERVYADSKYIYLTYDSTKILAISKTNRPVNYIDVGGSEILSDLCRSLDTQSVTFVNGPGLPKLNPKVPALDILVFYPHFDFIKSLSPSTKVYLINSLGKTDKRRLVEWVPCETIEEGILLRVSDDSPGDYVIFDIDTGMFL